MGAVRLVGRDGEFGVEGAVGLEARDGGARLAVPEIKNAAGEDGAVGLEGEFAADPAVGAVAEVGDEVGVGRTVGMHGGDEAGGGVGFVTRQGQEAADDDATVGQRQALLHVARLAQEGDVEGGIEGAVGVEAKQGGLVGEVADGEVGADEDFAIREHVDVVDRAGGAEGGDGIERGVERAVGVEAGEVRAIGAVGEVEAAADQEFAVGLLGEGEGVTDAEDVGVGEAGGVETRVERAIGI